MSTNNDAIRLADLGRASLSRAAQDVLAYAEQNQVELTDDAILTAASDETGLVDFGPGDFRGRLRVLMRDIAEDQNVTTYARNSVYQRLVSHAITRLRLADMLSSYPEIRDVPISKPIVIIGLPRSGTTYLQGILAADSRLTTLRNEETYEPILSVSSADSRGLRSDRAARYAERLRRATVLMPKIEALHSLDPAGVAEDVALRRPDFPIYPWRDVGGEITRYSHPDIYNHTPHYEYMRTMLKAIQWQRGEQAARWILKSPGHCVNIRPLLATFPDAIIVMSHRDPIAVIQSWIALHAYMSYHWYHEVKFDDLVARSVRLIETWLWSMIGDRYLIADEQLIDVPFSSLMGNEVNIVEQIFSAAGLTLTDDERSRIGEFIENNPRDKHGTMSYDMRSDYGLEPSELRQRFAFYLERFRVKEEVR